MVNAQEQGPQGVSVAPSLTYEYDEDVLRCLDHESATDRDADFEDDGQDGPRGVGCLVTLNGAHDVEARPTG